MKKDDLVSILITILVGFIGGGYLYVAHFTKLYGQEEVETQAEQAQFRVVAEAYGSCGSVCPAFQLKNDGGYRYRFYTSTTSAPELREGTLPLSEQRAIRRALDEASLREQSELLGTGNCAARAGGIDIRYTLVYQATEYTLDSCSTAIDGESELWLALSAVWQYLQTVE